MAHDLIGRFGELGRYFREIGACAECAKNFAAAAVRKETGRRVWSTEKDCVRPVDTNSKSCRDIAVDGWDARPGAHLHSSSAESTRKGTAHGSSVVGQRPAQGGVGPRPGAEGRAGSASERAGGDPPPTQLRL